MRADDQVTVAGPLSGRDWKLQPLTLDEVRVLRYRDAAERARDWAQFRQQWPMDLWAMAREFGAGVLLGFGLGLALSLYALAQVTA